MSYEKYLLTQSCLLPPMLYRSKIIFSFKDFFSTLEVNQIAILTHEVCNTQNCNLKKIDTLFGHADELYIALGE